MRIINGKYKYRAINSLNNLTFKPISTVIRESVFNVLENHLSWNEIKICDLFAGSGILGLEALSRGAQFCFFNDINKKNCLVLKKNLDKFKINAKTAEVFNTSHLQFIAQLAVQKQKLDLVFIDPPYQKPELITQTKEALIENKILNNGALLIIRTTQPLNPDGEKNKLNLHCLKNKKYGRHYVEFWKFDPNKSKTAEEFDGKQLIIISGPSGVGKKTIINNLLKEKALNLAYSVSLTTRKPRTNEKEGKDYFFTTDEEFQKEIAADNFIEYAQYVDKYYGTSKSYVQRLISQKKKVLLEIEILGALQIKAKFPKTIWIFLVPPTLDELENRINKRGTETPEEVAKRIKKAQQEINDLVKKENSCDYFVVNDEVADATKEILDILKKES